MEDKAALGAALMVVMVVVVNLLMYGFVRAWTRGSNKNLFESIERTFTGGRKKADELDELRRKLEELEQGKKQ